MSRKAEIPITPAVLEWAIAESGLALADVATAVGVDETEIQDWLADKVKPGVTELKKLAAKLHRQLAVFLLPRPPRNQHVEVSFRHPIGSQYRRALTAEERRFLRRARRLQGAQAWLTSELGRETPDIPGFSLTQIPENVASGYRERLGVSIDDQLRWRSPSVAFDAWRSAVEAFGVTVVQFSMGDQSCRGFSLWDDRAPLVVVNTALPDEARSFTLFHELGHLLTRTNSACAAAPMTAHAGDATERWCEAFAAAVLIPAAVLTHVHQVARLNELSRLASRLRVSVRAMALRLITLEKAQWRLYEEIPQVSDVKKKGGGGGTGRNRAEIRGDEFGRRTTEMFVAAVQREVISESQALDYLDIPSSAFERLSTAPVAH